MDAAKAPSPKELEVSVTFDPIEGAESYTVDTPPSIMPIGPPQELDPGEAIDSAVALRSRSMPTTYEGPKLDPWQILRNSLPPDVLAAIEEVTGHHTDPAPGDAPWFRCYDVREGRPSGHPDFQAIVKPGQHVYCPYVDPTTGVCGRKTVMPLENYVPA